MSDLIIKNESNVNEERELENFFTHYDNDIISQEQALRILEQLKAAVLNKDIEIINSICTLLKQNTINTNLQSIVEESCNKLFSDTQCTSTIINYTNSAEEQQTPQENILIINKGFGSCKHAFIYVESDFFDFDDEEVEYIKSLGIVDIDIIDRDTDKTIYSGPIDNSSEAKNDETRDGWLILIGVIILIGVGLTVTQIMNKF